MLGLKSNFHPVQKSLFTLLQQVIAWIFSQGLALKTKTSTPPGRPPVERGTNGLDAVKHPVEPFCACQSTYFTQSSSKKCSKVQFVSFIICKNVSKSQLCQKSTSKNQARGNRKTLKRPKLMSKINFRNLKLKSHEEYLICRTYFVN